MTQPTLVTQAEIDTYKRDGVVCVRNIFSADWIERLRGYWAASEEKLRNGDIVFRIDQDMLDADPRLAQEVSKSSSPQRYAEMVKTGSMGVKWAFLWDETIQDFVYESVAAQLVGELMEVDQVRFFWDQMFVRKAGSKTSTYWHNDMVAWPVEGTQIPSLWIPITPVKKGVNALSFVKRTHLDYDGKEWPRTANGNAMGRPDDRTDFTDWGSDELKDSDRIISFDMEPGDAVLIDGRVYHGGGRNDDPHNDRIALSTRWVGPDITWAPRKECVNVPGLPYEKMPKGQRPLDDKLFPLVWQR